MPASAAERTSRIESPTETVSSAEAPARFRASSKTSGAGLGFWTWLGLMIGDLPLGLEALVVQLELLVRGAGDEPHLVAALVEGLDVRTAGCRRRYRRAAP